MKIGQKLISGYVFIALLAGVSGSISIARSLEIKAHVDGISLSSINELEGVTEVAYLVQRITSQMRKLLMIYQHGETASINGIKDVIKECIKDLHKYSAIWRKGIDTGLRFKREEEHHLDIFQHYEKISGSYIFTVRKAIKQIEEENYLSARTLLEEEIEPLSAELHDIIESYEKEERLEIAAEADAIRRFVIEDIRINIISTLLALVGAICLGFLISGNIRKSVGILKEATIKIGEGNLDEVIKLKSDDEMAQLAEAFNMMSQNLKMSSHELRTVNDKLQCEIEEKTVITEELKGVNKELSTSQDVAISIMEELSKEVLDRKEAEVELKKRLDELERFRKVTIQREFRIKDLRTAVKELEEALVAERGYEDLKPIEFAVHNE